MQGIMQKFTLTLKISSHQLKFDIQINDDQDALFQKFKKLYPQCKHNKTEVLHKLRQDLQTKVKSKQVKPELKATIQYFIKKTFLVTEQRSSDSDRKTTNIVDINQEAKNKNHRSKQKYSCQQQSLSLQYHIKKAPQYCPTFKKQHNQSNKPQSNQISRPQSQKRKQSPNEDVVKACQTIMQKTNQNDMKEMARKYLEDIGRLPCSGKPNKDIVTIGHKKQHLEVQQNQFPIVVHQPNLQTNNATLSTPGESRGYASRTPIAQLDRETTKGRHHLERSTDKDRADSLNYRQARTRSFRGNKYDYLSFIEQIKGSTELILGDSYYRSQRNGGYKHKKFSYLLDFNN